MSSPTGTPHLARVCACSTLDLYERFVRECERRQENLTEQIIANTVRLGGYTNLDEAEAAQRRA